MTERAKSHAPKGWRFLMQTDECEKEAKRLGRKISGGKRVLLIPGYYKPSSNRKLWKEWTFVPSGFMIFVPDEK